MASHSGGAWEHFIHSVRRVLASIAPGSTVTEEGLVNFFVELRAFSTHGLLHHFRLSMLSSDPPRPKIYCLFLLKKNCHLLLQNMLMAIFLHDGVTCNGVHIIFGNGRLKNTCLLSIAGRNGLIKNVMLLKMTSSFLSTTILPGAIGLWVALLKFFRDRTVWLDLF